MNERRVISKILVIAFIAIFIGISTRHAFTAEQDEQQKLAQQIFTIFQNNCIRCHGADMKSGLDLRTRESVLKGGLHGAAIVPTDAFVERDSFGLGEGCNHVDGQRRTGCGGPDA